ALLDRAPAHARALLEQAHRVVVVAAAVVVVVERLGDPVAGQHPQVALLQRGGDRDHVRVLRQAHLLADPHDDGGVLHLPLVQAPDRLGDLRLIGLVGFWFGFGLLLRLGLRFGLLLRRGLLLGVGVRVLAGVTGVARLAVLAFRVLALADFAVRVFGGGQVRGPGAVRR